MVGVPRSKGCSLCIRRRVKCDQATPHCGNCTKYGAECPGYSKELVFVVVKPHRAGRSTSTTGRKTSKPRTAKAEDIHRVDPTDDPFSAPSSSSSLSSTSPPPTSTNAIATFDSAHFAAAAYEAQALSEVANYLKPAKCHARYLVIPRWLEQISSRPNPSAVLKWSVRSLVAHHIGRKQNDVQMLRYSEAAYGRALVGLQNALNHAGVCRSSDTLCAAMILGFYELFVGSGSGDSWMKHASGIARLMQLRGSALHRNEFDNSMIKAFRGIIIMDAIFNGKECFLAEPEWREVSRERYNDDIQPELYDALEEFIYLLSTCPALVRDGYDLRESNRRSEPIDLAAVLDLTNRTLDLHSKTSIWYTTLLHLLPFPTETPSTLPSPRYPTVYAYTDVFHGTVFCSYFALMIFLHEILMACGYGDYTAANNVLADQICRSVEFVTGGPMGPYRLGFAIRAAYEVEDVERRVWIRDLLKEFSRTYAATDVRGYPEVEEGRG